MIFFEDLSAEFRVNNVDSSLNDLFKNASQKRDVVDDENVEFDFTAGLLHSDRLKQFGMKKYCRKEDTSELVSTVVSRGH